MSSPPLLSTFLLLLLALAVTRLLRKPLARWAIPAIVAELLIGFALGNTVLPFASVEPLAGITELGVLTLFFQVGLEVRADLLTARPWTLARLVALSFLAPLLAWWPLVLWWSMPPATALLCLACLSATGTGVTLRLLAQRSALQTPSGRLLVAVSVLDDLPAMALLALAVAAGSGRLAQGAGWTGLVIGLSCAVLSLPLADAWVRRFGRRPLDPLALLLLLVGSAWVAERSGLTPLLGALWGGVLLNRLAPPGHDLGGLLALLSDVFLPLYFISVGMRVSAGSLLQGSAWSLALALVLLAFLSKLACALGVNGEDRRQGIDRWMVVFGLMPRGLPGLVFATTALGAGVIDHHQFSALVLMVAVTTVIGLLLLERRLQAPRCLGLNPDSV